MNTKLQALIDKVIAVQTAAVNELEISEAGLVPKIKLYLSINWHPLVTGLLAGIVIGGILSKVI